ncbi:MAG: hypothetical protein AAFV53_23040 [Myxococcota bacterium]
MPVRDLSRRRALALLAASAGAMTAASALGAPLSKQPPHLSGYLPDPPDGGMFTLSDATILSHDGTTMSGGIRVEGGKIVEVGPGVTGGTPLSGRWLSPGFTDAGCQLGLVEVSLEASTRDNSESTDAVTPDARVVDGYNPLSNVIPVTRVNGITTVLVHPSTDHLVTGQAALMHTAGLHVDAATVMAPAGLCINLGRAARGDGGPKTRMGTAMRLRALLEEAPRPPSEDNKKRRKKKKGDGDGDLSITEKIWKAVRAGEMKAIIGAHRVDDILTAIELIQAYELDAVLLGCTEGHLAAREIADAGLPVLLGPLDVQPDNFEHPHAIYENARILHDAGVKMAFRTGSVHDGRQLPTHAALAVAHGLPFEAAIAALTSAPGEIFGVEGLGRMEAGAPATFFEVDGDPLQPRFPVRRLWINGRATSMETRQTRLYERYRSLY